MNEHEQCSVRIRPVRLQPQGKRHVRCKVLRWWELEDHDFSAYDDWLLWRAMGPVSVLWAFIDLPVAGPWAFTGMSGNNPGRMAPESSKVVVLPKFDMHIYTSELTSEELKTAIIEYCIPTDLHPRLPHSGGRAIKCFKEVTTSLKGWKKKFFLIDHRAVPDAMPWRHGDTNLHDDFSTHYDEGDVAHLCEVLVPLRPPPRHLLYVCGLTTAYRHLDLRYDIKDPDMNGYIWGDPIPEEQRPKPRVTHLLPVGAKLPELIAAQKNLEKPDAKITAAREKKEQQNLAKAKAKPAGAGGGEGSRKKRKVQKVNEAVQSGSEETLSATPLHQDDPGIGTRPATTVALEIAQEVPSAERMVVNLSRNTRVSTPPMEVNQPSPHHGRQDMDLSPPHDTHSPQSSHHGNKGKLITNRERVAGYGEGFRKEEGYCFRSGGEDMKLGEGPGTQAASKLNTSVEYRKSLASPVQLCYTAGWLGGLSLGRTEAEIARFLSKTEDLDIEGSKLWEVKHREIFTMSYPFVEKIAATCDLPMSKLLKVSLDVPLPPLYGGTSGVADEDVA
nr:hypothetical protein [Tanacetum cinerariifolium]